MRKSRFTESQIVGILKEGEAGIPLAELVRTHGDVLQLAVEVRGHERRRVETDEGARGRAREAETFVCRPRPRERNHQRCAEPKLSRRPRGVRPSSVLTTEHHLSVRRACRVAGLARAAWYAPPVVATERDAAVIKALQQLVTKNTRWSFWKCYDRIRLDGHPWNHKRVYRVYAALRLNLPRRTRRRVPPQGTVPPPSIPQTPAP